MRRDYPLVIMQSQMSSEEGGRRIFNHSGEDDVKEQKFEGSGAEDRAKGRELRNAAGTRWDREGKGFPPEPPWKEPQFQSHKTCFELLSPITLKE